MKEVSDFISSVGFPVVVCLMMLYQQEKISDSYIEIVESLKELVSDNTKSINLLIAQTREAQNENRQEATKTIPNNK